MRTVPCDGASSGCDGGKYCGEIATPDGSWRPSTVYLFTESQQLPEHFLTILFCGFMYFRSFSSPMLRNEVGEMLSHSLMPTFNLVNISWTLRGDMKRFD